METTTTTNPAKKITIEFNEKTDHDEDRNICKLLSDENIYKLLSDGVLREDLEQLDKGVKNHKYEMLNEWSRLMHKMYSSPPYGIYLHPKTGCRIEIGKNIINYWVCQVV
jgi:hypothetical protein